MTTVVKRLTEIDDQIRKAVAIAQSDSGGLRVLTAVVVELQNKSKNALEMIQGATDAKVWEAVVKLEQAADSARIAIEVDTGVEELTRAAILDVHQAISDLKRDVGSD